MKKDVMHTLRKMFSVAMMVIAGASAANAQGIVWDQGPGTGTYDIDNAYINQTGDQNFADSVKFETDTYVDGINYFTRTGFDFSTHTGTTDFHVKVLADAAGNPGAVVSEWDQTFSSITLDAAPGINEVAFSFAPVLFSANTQYWVGLSGNGFEAAQMTVLSPGDGNIAVFQGPDYRGLAAVGDQMFQLTAVPEPDTCAMLLAGLGLIGFMSRRRSNL